MNADQLDRLQTAPGLVATLDLSDEATARAPAASVVPAGDRGRVTAGTLVSRVVTSPVFTADRVVGAVLSQQALDQPVGAAATAEYLWTVKNIVPFLALRTELAGEHDGVRLFRPVAGLPAALERATRSRVFGARAHSVVRLAADAGIKGLVEQQFHLARQLLATGLVPVLAPEVDIESAEKADAEILLRGMVLEQLDQLDRGQRVLLELTLPEQANFYADLVAHPRVLRVLALSGGYSREVAAARLTRNHGVTAGFSRALVEGLRADQGRQDFERTLDQALDVIADASNT